VTSENLGLLRVDLHSHTNRSLDAFTAPEELVERARETGLDRIAVTDHGEIEGALRARELDPNRVIVGQEIRCDCGTELIGLYLRQRIPMYRPLVEVVARIRDQGGVVYAPHPYAYPWRPVWKARRAIGVADIVEAFNARAFVPAWNRAASRVARRRGLPAGAGSDAHFPAEIGRAYTEMPAFRDAAGFRRALSGARPVGLATTGPALHVASSAMKAARLSWDLANTPIPLPRPRAARLAKPAPAE
jgi:hypothetical protein